MRRLATPALPPLAFLVACLLAGAARAEPALFVARAPGITAFLLGSMHGLKPGTEWRGAAIGRAFDASSECWFEMVLPGPGDPATAMAVMRGIDLERRLPTLLSPADDRRLAARAAALNIPGGAGALDGMKPWLAWTVLEAHGMTATGLDPAYGVDRVLEEDAKAEHKTVVGLETLDEQVGFLADQPQATMLRALHQALAAPPGDWQMLVGLQRLWLAGRIDAVGRILSREGRTAPALFRTLLLDRNKAWARRLAGLRGSGKTILVTVGAGHLAGPGNLRDLLRAQRFSITRVWR